MKFLEISKDGGPKSKVWAYWLFEIKGLFSVALLRFEDGSREAYHSHAFNSISWVLSGELTEHVLGELDSNEDPIINWYQRSIRPIVTFRETFHKVISRGRTWVFTLRGPWANEWYEFDEPTNSIQVLTDGRQIKQTTY